MMKKLRGQMKWIMAIIAVAFLFSTFLMYEGRSGRRTPGRNPDGTMTDYEVAEINGRPLMRSELERGFRSALNNLGQRNLASVDIPAIYKAVLDQFAMESQMAREVEERGISVSDAEAEMTMKEYADRYYTTREEFYQTLRANGLTPEEYKKEIARQMAARQLYQSAIGDVEISDEQAMGFYNDMKDLFYKTPEGFEVHFASFSEPGEAEALRARIVSGKSWADAVSADKPAGDKDVSNATREPVFLPSSALSGMFAPLASLDVGQISEVFPISSSDFAVGMKVSHVPETVRSYDAVSADIRLMMQEQETRRRLDAFQKELMDKAKVVIHDPSLFPKPVSPDVAPKAE